MEASSSSSSKEKEKVLGVEKEETWRKWKRTLGLKRLEKMDARECWTGNEFLVKTKEEEKRRMFRSAAAAAAAVEEAEEEEDEDEDDALEEALEDEAVLGMLKKSARAAMLAEQQQQQQRQREEEDDEDDSDLAAYLNYVRAVKTATEGGVDPYYSDADEDEMEAKLESIQDLLDALREENDATDEDKRKMNNKLDSLQNIMDHVYSFREEHRQQLALVPEIVVSDVDKDEDALSRRHIFRADSVKRKRKKAMNKHKHRKRKKKDRFKNK